MSIKWSTQDKRLSYGNENDDTRARRVRAKNVVDEYPHIISDQGVTFHGNLRVVLGDTCTCTCQDFRQRGFPCKHIFAAAALMGDTAAILDMPLPAKARTVSTGNSGRTKWRPTDRPQDVRVGKYFVLSDFLYSHDAVAKGIANLPPSLDCPEIDGMRGLCANILDPVVEKFGPVSIAYGYCSTELWRRQYGQNANLLDLHTFKPKQGGIGGAVDIVIHGQEDVRPVINWIKRNCVYDRLIIYPGSRIICVAWCGTKPRYQAMEWIFVPGGKPQYLKAGEREPPKPHFTKADLQKATTQLPLEV
jgi:SWIM zinc finger